MIIYEKKCLKIYKQDIPVKVNYRVETLNKYHIHKWQTFKLIETIYSPLRTNEKDKCNVYWKFSYHTCNPNSKQI